MTSLIGIRLDSTDKVIKNQKILKEITLSFLNKKIPEIKRKIKKIKLDNTGIFSKVFTIG